MDEASGMKRTGEKANTDTEKNGRMREACRWRATGLTHAADPQGLLMDLLVLSRIIGRRINSPSGWFRIFLPAPG